MNEGMNEWLSRAPIGMNERIKVVIEQGTQGTHRNEWMNGGAGEFQITCLHQGRTAVRRPLCSKVFARKTMRSGTYHLIGGCVQQSRLVAVPAYCGGPRVLVNPVVGHTEQCVWLRQYACVRKWESSQIRFTRNANIVHLNDWNKFNNQDKWSSKCHE